jgi:uncharacterized protein (TIGR00290 family)
VVGPSFIYLIPLEISFPAICEHSHRTAALDNLDTPPRRAETPLVACRDNDDVSEGEPSPQNDARPVALSWSGGKDSALALRALRAAGAEPVALLTTFTAEHDRISMHAVRRELARAQAAATAIPLVEVDIPAACPDRVYEARMEAALARPPLAGVEAIAFADLFLEDIRAYREERLESAGRRALFPVWGRDTAELAREFIEAGFEATLVCVDPERLDASFVGRRFDEALLAELPAGVDPCGENGEFHTFVHAGPIFDRPISIELGEKVLRGGFAFQDVLPALAGASRLV